MRFAHLIVLLLAAACAPTAGPPSDVVVTPEHIEAYCRARGGHTERVGKLQALRCIIAYADAGKACTDGAHCLGQRCVSDFDDTNASTPATGTCVATNNPFGCQTLIEAGVARTICVD